MKSSELQLEALLHVLSARQDTSSSDLF